MQRLQVDLALTTVALLIVEIRKAGRRRQTRLDMLQVALRRLTQALGPAIL